MKNQRIKITFSAWCGGRRAPRHQNLFPWCSLFNWLALLSVLTISTAFFIHFQPSQKSDPDYYYHIALSRWMQDHPIPKVLPQIVGIGWDQRFVDKEFLFHQVTALAYRLAGEPGVGVVPLVFLLVLISSTWMILRRDLSTGKLLLMFAVCLLPFYWLNRMILVRPHVLSVFLVVYLCVALQTKSKRTAGLIGVLFSLSYHALQIPGLILIGYHLTTAKKNAAAQTTLKWALAGFGIGLVLHPYFPGVLGVAWQHIQVALSMAEIQHPVYGNEMYPWTTSDLLLGNLLTFGVMGAAIRAGKVNSFNFLAAAIFWGIACFTPRGQEYSIPLTALLLSQLMTNRKGLDSFAYQILALLSIAQTIQFIGHYHYKTMHQESLLQLPHQLNLALEKIPSDAHSQILNSSWQLGPAIFYTRPNLQFLDLLDPSFFSRAEPELSVMRQDLLRGVFRDVYPVVTTAFNSEYVLGISPIEEPLRELLEKDSRFRRVFPKDWPDRELRPVEQVFLYSVRREN